MSTAMVFAIADYIVLGSSLLISALIGIYFVASVRKNESRANYFLGNREMGVIPVSFSYMATGISAVTFIGIPSEVYRFGPNLLVYIPARLLGVFVITRTAVPIYHRLKLTSIYEYLEMRFDRRVKIVGIVFYYGYALCTMGFVVYAPALALSLITGMTEVVSIFILTIVCIFYTTIGGMKAVIWTDVFQGILLLIGLVAIAVGALMEVGGFGEMSELVAEGGRAPSLDFTPDITIRYTVYAMSSGGFFTAISLLAMNQPMLQRCLCCPNIRKAQIVIMFGFSLAVIAVLLTILCGLLVYAYYADCDPLTAGRIQRIDQIIPLIIGDLFSRYKGLAGLVVSGAFSACLSTISSSLNSMSAVFEAAILNHVLENTSDKRLACLSKFVTLVFGLICTGIALLATKLSGILEETIAFTSILKGPLGAVFFLGFFVPRCNARGALIGLATGFALGLWIKIGSEFYPLPGRSPALSVGGCTAQEGEPYNVTSYSMFPDKTSLSLHESTTSLALSDLPSSDDNMTHSALLSFYNMSVYLYVGFTFILTFTVGVIVTLITRPEPFEDTRCLMTPMEFINCCTSGVHSYEGFSEETERPVKEECIEMSEQE